MDNIYQEMEVWYPYFRFQEAGAEVVAVGAKAGETYTSKLGYPIKSHQVVMTTSAPRISMASWFPAVMRPISFAATPPRTNLCTT